MNTQFKPSVHPVGFKPCEIHCMMSDSIHHCMMTDSNHQLLNMVQTNHSGRAFDQARILCRAHAGSQLSPFEFMADAASSAAPSDAELDSGPGFKLKPIGQLFTSWTRGIPKWSLAMVTTSSSSASSTGSSSCSHWASLWTCPKVWHGLPTPCCSISCWI